jgi:hypothetical protein
MKPRRSERQTVTPLSDFRGGYKSILNLDHAKLNFEISKFNWLWELTCVVFVKTLLICVSYFVLAQSSSPAWQCTKVKQTMDHCAYSEIFGVPEKGIHSYRLFGVAIVDVLLTVIFAFALSCMFSIPIVFSMIGLFLLGIVLHSLFCVRTTIDTILFPNSN